MNIRRATEADFESIWPIFRAVVVSTNEAAVALWKKLGFAIVGTLPKAFRHRQLGDVDAYVMYRFLS